ncbi:U-box domain-containing protein 26-like [Rhodamnia argentea]|uniref:U-box domain-containing protein n=1 Tax=Rhodamnia argentea TaxID=178133 RepID=A0A8B8N2K4_9MYRT|nr:U-box domain-containing protein 26-like [Rhodamnia argentea]
MRGGLSLEPLDMVGVQIPHHFRCPISLELMRDPVTVSTGQTYDRSSIEPWIAAGNTTCPVTRAPLLDSALIPNHTLRRLIQSWCVANRHSGVERIPTPKQPADPSRVRLLLSQSASSSSAARLSALRRLRTLARDSDKNRALISSLDARPLLLDILFSDPRSESSELAHESLALLAMLQLAEPECASVASDPDRVAYLTGLLFHPCVEVRINAAALIEAAVAGVRSPELRGRVSGAAGVFEGVVGLLQDCAGCPRALKAGARAAFALCLVKPTRHRAVAAGAGAALVDRLGDLERGDAERVLATIELLCRVPAGCAALAAHALSAPLLVRMILKVSDRATEYAAGALLALCSASEQCRREAVAAGVVTQLLLLVQSECTERAKRKAQLLLKLLRDSWPEDPIGNSDNYACSEVVVPF